MSLEYLTVNEGWRKKNIGLSLGNVLVGLSGLVLKAVDYDASVAPSRSDVGVTNMACDIGGEVVVPNIEMHKTKCDLIAIRKSRLVPHPSEPVNELVQRLWNKRKDYTKYTLNFNNEIKNAA